MAFNGSGTFVRLYDWTDDAANGIPITASRVDGEDDGFATGLTTCITKDGQTTPTANIGLGGFKITNLAAATATTDAARFGNVALVASERQTASASATLDFVLDTTNFNVHIFVLSNILPVTDGQPIYVRVSTDGGATWKSGATDYEYHTQIRKSNALTYSALASQGETFIRATNSNGNGAGEGANGTVTIISPTAASFQHIHGEINYFSSDATALLEGCACTGAYNGAAEDVNGIQFLFASGNIASGTIDYYGIRAAS